MTSKDDLELIAVAKRARDRAYAPYSRYAVGAAVRGEDGRIWAGCNIENISFGLTICAERVAMAKMVSEGCRRLEKVVVVTTDGSPPCGACLQAIREFSRNPAQVTLFLVGDSGLVHVCTLAELLPHSFASREVRPLSVP